MNFNEYRPLALRTAKRGVTLRDDFEHAALGFSTESGEAKTVIKRVVIYNKPLTEDMRLHALEELADTGWYVPLAMLAHHIDELDPVPAEELMEVFTPVSNDLKQCGLFLAALCGAIAMAATIPDEDYGTRSHRDEIRGVLTAIVFVLDHMATLLDSSGDEMRANNIAKLRLRFPDAYSDAAAEARADKGGLDATQS